MAEDPERDTDAQPSGAEPNGDKPTGEKPKEQAGVPVVRIETAAEPKQVAGYTPSYVFLAVVTIGNLVADLWSKHWAKAHFETAPLGEQRMVILENHLNFIFAKNKGGAWGLLQNENEALRRPFFLIVSVAAIVFIVSLYRKLQPNQIALKWGLPLVLGGALGNLVDRIRYGYVVDFIDVYMTVDGKVKHWPTFNVADIAICVGVGLMAVDMFTSREKKPAANPAEAKKVEPVEDDGADAARAAPDETKDEAPPPKVDDAPRKSQPSATPAEGA